MRKHTRTPLLILIVATLSIGLLSTAALALSVGDILKVGGIAYLVTQYGGQIDNFINKSLGEREAQVMGATKVVPILSLGRGGYIGASQVIGAPDAVQRVKAVVQVEARFGSFGAKVYVPVATDRATKNPERVAGAGVSAVIEFKI